MLSLRANAKYTGDHWKDAHNRAVADVLEGQARRPFETMLVSALFAWALYADDHRARYESPIGEDGVLGPKWRAIGLALRGLLNGELGRLDGGTLDAFILDTLKAEGVEVEGL